VNYELIIVRYSEIALKAKETRKRFENILINNIKDALNKEKITNEIKKEWGRIYIYTSQIEKSIKILKKIFGIKSVSPAFVTNANIKEISKLVIELSKIYLQIDISFAIRTTRTGSHNFSSQDVAIKVGKDVENATNAKVNLSNPDIEIFIEIRNKKAYVFTKKISCVGGLPLGSQGTVISIFDHPFSLLSTWYILRRGCNVIIVDITKNNSMYLTKFLEYWYTKPLIISEEFNLNFLNKLNNIALKENCDAVVTDHVLREKNSNIISNLKSFKKNLKIPVLSPLIFMDEDEIDKKFKEIRVNV
jgi:thiamine biosynthesis protein ThiI